MPPETPYRLIDGLGIPLPVDYAALTGQRKPGATLSPNTATLIIGGGGGGGVSGDGQNGLPGQSGLPGIPGPPGPAGPMGPPQAPITADYIIQLITNQHIPADLIDGLRNGTRMPCGSGADGAVHYTTDTVLALGANVIHATDFTLDAGKLLTCDPADYYILIYCTGTFTMGADSQIAPWVDVRGAGGTGGVGSGGIGGYAGRPAGGVFVYCNDINMSSTARLGGGENGEAGHTGGASSAAGTGNPGATGTIPFGAGATKFRGVTAATTAPVNGNFAVDHGTPATAGTAISLAGLGVDNWARVLRHASQFIHHQTLGPGGASWMSDILQTFCCTGSGGCQGCDDGGAFGARAIGGPAGASAGFFSVGLAGTGTPDPGTNGGAGSATGGGGGGPGGWGGITVLVVSGTVISGGVLSAAGGNGGRGGNAAGTGPALGGAGEAGPGGNGGLLYYWGPEWTGTSTAAGGTKGAQGTSYGGAPVPTAASDGTAGYSFMCEDPE